MDMKTWTRTIAYLIALTTLIGCGDDAKTSFDLVLTIDEWAHSGSFEPQTAYFLLTEDGYIITLFGEALTSTTTEEAYVELETIEEQGRQGGSIDGRGIIAFGAPFPTDFPSSTICTLGQGNGPDQCSSFVAKGAFQVAEEYGAEGGIIEFEYLSSDVIEMVIDAEYDSGVTLRGDVTVVRPSDGSERIEL